MTQATIIDYMPFGVGDIPLGSLVLSKSNPTEDSWRSPKELESGENFTKYLAKNTNDSSDSSSSTAFLAKLTKILTLGFKKSRSDKETYGTGEHYIYRLTNPRQWFRDICTADKLVTTEEATAEEDPTARKWIEEMINEGCDMYLVVGLETLTDATRKRDNKGHVQGDMGLVVPVPQDASGLTDASLKGNHTSSHENHHDATYIDERVYNVYYRKVEFELFKDRSPDTAKLSRKPRWKRVSATRAQDVAEEYIECGLDSDDEEEQELCVSQLALDACGECDGSSKDAGLNPVSA